MSIAYIKNSCQGVVTWLTGTWLDFGSSFRSELLWHVQKHPSFRRESNYVTVENEVLNFAKCFFPRTVGGWSFGGSAACYWLWLQVKHFLASKCKSSTGRSRKTLHDAVVYIYFEAKDLTNILWLRYNKKESYVKLLSKFFRSGNISSTSSLPVGIINLVRTSLKVLPA